MIRPTFYLAFVAVVASAASTNLTISDLVTSQVYSEVETIGFAGLENKHLHPNEYITLHRNQRLVNFRGLWKKWCKSMEVEATYRTFQTEFEAQGVDFWELVNGECLFLGPMKWMRPSDIRDCGCAPLLNVPMCAETQINVPRTNEHIAALIERTYDLGAADNRGFLARNADLRSLIRAYADDLSWDSDYWYAFNYAYHDIVDFMKMLPPPGQLNASHLPRVICVICVLKFGNAPIEPLYNLLNQCLSLRAYAEFLQDKTRLTWQLFKQAFDAIPAENQVFRMLWVRLTYDFLSTAPEGEAIKQWVLEYPKNYPQFSVFRHHLIKYPAEVQVPDCMLDAMEEHLVAKVPEKFLSMYSIGQQARFVSWMLRELPAEDRAPIFPYATTLVFGKIYQFSQNSEKRHFPSADAFEYIFSGIKNNSISVSDATELALTYGFCLNLSNNGLDLFCQADKIFQNALLAKVQLRRPILEYMKDPVASVSLGKFDASPEINRLVADKAVSLTKPPPQSVPIPVLNLSPMNPGDLTYIDLVLSTAYSGLNSIGINESENMLLPQNYVELHKEKRLLNFRSLWMKWCKDLTDRDKYEQAQRDFASVGVDFWKVMNGECLFLGPMKWMTPADIRACQCAPLQGVPVNEDTIANAPKLQNIGNIVGTENDVLNKLKALIDRTLEKGGTDNFGFLNRAYRSVDTVVINYFKSIVWNHRHWDVISPVGLTDEMIFLMLPPANQLTVANLPRVLRVIAFLKLKMFKTTRYYNEVQVLELDLLKSLALRPLLASPLRAYADFLDIIRPVTCPRFKDAFNAIPSEDHVMRAYWIRANVKVFEQLPDNDDIKFADDVKIPAAALSLPSDDLYLSSAGMLPIMYSLREQINIASWYLRELPTDSLIYRDSSEVFIKFGYVYDSSFPSHQIFTQLLNALIRRFNTSPQNVSATDANELIEMALAYGFHLPLPDTIKMKYRLPEGSSFVLRNPFMNRPRVISGILNFLGDANNASHHSVFNASSEDYRTQDNDSDSSTPNSTPSRDPKRMRTRVTGDLPVEENSNSGSRSPANNPPVSSANEESDIFPLYLLLLVPIAIGVVVYLKKRKAFQHQ